MKPKYPRWSTIAAILLASTSVACAIDSDGDGLDNSVETNTGIYVSATNTGTNPQNPDTDGDGVPDGLEVKEHTNPLDATKFNSFSKGMVAYYPLDGNASDATGKGNTGIETNVTYVSDRSNSVSSAGDFRQNAYVEVPNLLSLKNYPITYSTWIYLETYHTNLSWRGWGDMFILGKDQPGIVGSVLGIHTDEQSTNALSYTDFRSNYVPSLKNWIQVALTINIDREAALYINGAQTASWQASIAEFTDLPFRISTPYIFNQFARQSFQGYLDDARIYNRALDSGEVKALYSSERPHFQIIQGSYTWQEAKADAEARGGRLAVLNTQAKIDEVNGFLDASKTWPDMWLGLNDEAQEGVWRWITGDLVTASRWSPTNPNNGNNIGPGQDYGVLYSSGHAISGLWDDQDSSQSKGYLLEISKLTLSLAFSIQGSITGAGEYEPGATATLTAVPNPGYKFTGWTGDASGTTNPLSIAMDADKSVAATFAPDMSDSDGDGLNNYEEVTTYGTDPTKDDTDGDGLKDGWEVGVGRFSIIAGSRTWPQARADAHARGGELACFPTEDRWTRGMASLGAGATDDYTGLWIGATDATVEGTWTWVNGEAFSYSRWASSRPSVTVGNTLDYAEVAGGNGAEVGMWYDRSSSTTRDGYILEAGHATDPKTADVDGDGLNDGAEQTAGTNPFLADTDSDGYLDGAEVEFGGNPLAAASVPGFKARIAMVPAADSIQFSFPAQQGISYTVLDSINLIDWNITESNVIGQGAVITRSYSTANQPKRYFRARRN